MNKAAIFTLFLVLSFLLFGNGTNGDFVFDDRSIIIDNPLIENWVGFFKAFLSPYHYARPQSGLYRPLTFASFTANWHILSANPAGFHVVNIILHAVSSFLIFLIIFGLKNKRTAIIGSLLFLFLPIHVEAVTSIVGRGELLMFLFFLLAFRAVQKDSYKTASVWFLLSLLSKETGLAFIPVFLFFEFVWKKTAVKKLAEKMLYFVPPLIAYAALRYGALGTDYFISTNAYSFFNPIAAMDFLSGLLTAFKVLFLYVQKLIFPTYFSSDYSYNQITEVESLFASWQAVAGIAIFIFFTFLFVIKRKSLIGLGALIFLFSYLIVSNLIIKIGTIMAERLMYMPSFGFVLVISDILSSLSTGFKRLAKVFLTLFVIVLVVYGVQTVRGNSLWKDEKTLFENAYKHAPGSVVNIANIAGILLKDGRNNEALEKVEEAIAIEPKNSPALHLNGQIYYEMGDIKKAEELWKKAIEAQPDFLYPYLSLGTLYYNRGDFNAGERIMELAREMYGTPNVVALLAFNKIGLEKFSQAIEPIEKEFGLKPKEFELRFVLGVAYLKSNNEQKARELLLELKDPSLTDESFIGNLKGIKIFNLEI